MLKVGLLFRLRRAFKALASSKHTETPAFWGGLVIELLSTFAPGALNAANSALSMLPGVGADFSLETLVPFLITYAMLRFAGKVADPEKVKEG